ncbi:MAG TPA: gliding motility-associated C-terminal domain-containing protein, partial [Bacteroidales bacterium]
PASTSTIFNYSLLKVEDSNGCIATSMSGTKKAVVYTMPKSDAGPAADTVCGPVVTLKAIPTVGTGTWYFPSAVVASTPNSSTVTVTIDSLFSEKSISHKFIWKEINWQCAGKDSINVTFFKRAGPVNAGRKTTLYSFDNIFHTSATPVQVGSGEWSLVEGSGTFDDIFSDSTVIKDLSAGLNRFQWKVTNGRCIGTDILEVDVKDILVPQGFSPNNDGINDKLIINGLDLPNQIAELKIVNSAGSEVFSTSNINGKGWMDWDGKNTKGDDLPEGTYYYMLKLISAGKSGNGQVHKESGFIILKRY